MPSFSFADFSDVSDFTLNGDAAQSGSAVRLTPAVQNQRGSAFLTTPITLPTDGSFTCIFSFKISNNGGSSESDGQGADGILFVLHDGPNTALGSKGGFLGYAFDGGAGAPITNSVAAGVDTWDNSGVPQSDPDGNHLEVDTSGTFPSDAEASVATRFNDGSVNWMWVEYDGTELTVYFSETSAKPASPSITHTVDLPAEWGTVTVYPGFTSAGASAYADHDILSWRMEWGRRPRQTQVMVVG